MSISALTDCVATIRAESDHHRRAIGLHTADTLAVLHAALKAREGAAIARFFGEGDEATRAAGMAAVIRFTECDDIHVPSCMTAGAIVIPVALAFAPTARATRARWRRATRSVLPLRKASAASRRWRRASGRPCSPRPRWPP